jgi:hypothetical protein
VCAEKLTAYPFYFANHPKCTLNTSCDGAFYSCSTLCPEPTSYDRDGGSECAGDSSSNSWLGCRGSGCAVCKELISAYPKYLQNHPSCILNETCGGSFGYCSSRCPAPSIADK